MSLFSSLFISLKLIAASTLQFMEGIAAKHPFSVLFHLFGPWLEQQGTRR